MKKSTITDLPNDIKKLVPDWQNHPALVQIITEAEAGEFHDYKNTKYVCGKMQLIEMLRIAGNLKLLPIAKDIRHGVYDESPDEQDKAAMKKDWLENGGDIGVYETLFGQD